jgi:hypothetical protein
LLPQGGDSGEALTPRCLNARFTGDDHMIGVDQHRDGETELSNGRHDFDELLFRVPARVAGIGFEFADWQVDDGPE